jgi:hypothetical protein
MDTLNSQQQADNDALATAVGVAAQELGLGDVDDVVATVDADVEAVDVTNIELDGETDFPQGPDFGSIIDGDKEDEEDVDVSGLDLPDDDMEDGLGINLDDIDDREDRPSFSRPPSIRKGRSVSLGKGHY